MTLRILAMMALGAGLGAVGCNADTGTGGGGGDTSAACQGMTQLVYGNGRFVRLVSGDNRAPTRVDYSDDEGVTWRAAADVPTGMRRAVFGNGVFFSAASSQYDEVPNYRSTDGITWEAQHGERGDVAFGDGIFVRATSRGIYTSPDAQSWHLTEQSGTFESESMVRFADGLFVASDLGRLVETSTDGVTWTVVPDPDFYFDSVIDALPFQGGIVLARDTGGGDETSYVTGFTPDLHRWSQGPRDRFSQLTAFAGNAIAARWSLQGSLHVSRTTDGWNWEDGPAFEGDDAAIAASEKAVVAATSCSIQTSANGVEWQKRSAQ
jgi:hypothetical protein